MLRVRCILLAQTEGYSSLQLLRERVDETHTLHLEVRLDHARMGSEVGTGEAEEEVSEEAEGSVDRPHLEIGDEARGRHREVVVGMVDTEVTVVGEGDLIEVTCHAQYIVPVSHVDGSRVVWYGLDS